jgi:hypothetical protein
MKEFVWGLRPQVEVTGLHSCLGKVEWSRLGFGLHTLCHKNEGTFEEG